MSESKTYFRAYQLALSRFEMQLKSKIAQNRNKFIRDIAKNYKDGDSIPAYMLDSHKLRISEILAGHYNIVTAFFGRISIKQIKSFSVRLETKRLTLHSSFMAEWISREALLKSVLISTTDTSDIIIALMGGISDGLGSDEIARNIRKVSLLTPFRAATIARTETGNAASFGGIQTARALEDEVGIILEKSWIPVNDSIRTRPSHLAMIGSKPIGLDEKFIVGGERMDRPNDSTASAANVINCRCALIFSEKE